MHPIYIIYNDNIYNILLRSFLFVMKYTLQSKQNPNLGMPVESC